MAVLLNAISADTTGNSVQIWDYSQSHLGYRPFTILIRGTLGGGTAKIQISNDNINWIDGYTTTSVPVPLLFECTARFVRGVLTGSTSPSLTLELT